MRLTALSLVLQQFAPSPADTAEARAYLANALDDSPAVVRSVTVNGVEHPLIHQLWKWGLRSEAIEAAVGFDARAARRTPESAIEFRRTIAQLMLEAGDTIAILTLIAAASPEDRDLLRASIVNGGADGHDFARSLESMIERPDVRATVLYYRAQRLLHGQSPDTTIARATLSEAIQLAQLVDASHQRSTLFYWLAQLRELGAAVSVSDLLSATGAVDPWVARFQVAGTLARSGDRGEATPLLDALVLEAAWSGWNRRPLMLAHVYELRGTSRDSASADVLYDSAQTLGGLIRSSTGAIQQRVQDTWVRRDTSLLRQVLAAETVPLESLRNLLQQSSALLTPQVGSRPDDRASAFADMALRHTERHLNYRSGTERDSLAMWLVQLRARLDVSTALMEAGRIETDALRERALAAAAVRLAQVDADSARRIAESLSDDLARDLLYPVLALRAVEGGRLPVAEDLATRIPSSQERVRVWYALAAANWREGRRESAMQLDSALKLLDPRESCQHCVVAVGLGEPPPVWQGTRSMLIDAILDLAVRQLSEDDLEAWASSQVDVERRVWAHVKLAGALERRFRPFHAGRVIP